MNDGTMLGRADMQGTINRSVVLTGVLLLLLGLCLAIKSVLALEFPVSWLLIVAASFWVAMVAGMFAAEYPQGDLYAMARISSATFCRTGLPLFVFVIMVRYLDESFVRKTIGFMAAFYGVGLVTSIRLSLKRFANSDQEPREVERAAD